MGRQLVRNAVRLQPAPEHRGGARRPRRSLIPLPGAARLAAALLAGTACGPEARPARREAVPDSLRLELLAPAEARVGSAVPLTLRLTNATDRPVAAHFLGREIAFDLVVHSAGGAVVWQRLRGATVPSILQVRVLEPGETLEWQDVWRPRNTGRYIGRGRAALRRAGAPAYTAQGDSRQVNPAGDPPSELYPRCESQFALTMDGGRPHLVLSYQPVWPSCPGESVAATRGIADGVGLHVPVLPEVRQPGVAGRGNGGGLKAVGAQGLLGARAVAGLAVPETLTRGVGPEDPQTHREAK
ncbi:MAG: BsuPI-related putative proteinase inhibitor [Gemmatimonadales bacterium]